MRRDELIAELEDHRARIDRAIQILKSGARRSRRCTGKGRKRRFTAAARKRISEGQKRRWEAARQAKVRQIEK
jgi:hypothetical protein